ncbi:transmembrane 70, mitochondrial [Pelobates cultripes]|uniref:Transmembrane 70, mitochondrial n=1 Tax=Pelobates cultripes TaxID=61616 RepID=A0AAD1S2M5_PELCU|nr:transmembrane 70, mitochondrial [Pelobates cultripes]
MLRFAGAARALSVTCRRYVSSQPCALSGFLWTRDKPQRNHVALTRVNLPYVSHLRFNTSFIPENTDLGRMVYAGNLAKSVLGVKFFSYSTSVFTVCIMPYIMLQSGIAVDNLALKIAFCSIVGFFTFVTPVTLHIITKGYVVRLYHNRDKDTYTAVTYNALLREKRTIFSQKDVEIPGVSKMFTTFYAGKKSMLVNPDLFPNPQDYSHLMGYDKPFTFNPEELEQSSKNE